MADEALPSMLLDLPIEVRHEIFQHAAVREVGAKRVLQRWFEKRDANRQYKAYVANFRGKPKPRILYYDGTYPEDDESDESEWSSDDEDEDGEEDNESDEDEQDEDEQDEDEQDEDEQDEDENEDEDTEEDEITGGEDNEEQEEGTNDDVFYAFMHILDRINNSIIGNYLPPNTPAAVPVFSATTITAGAPAVPVAPLTTTTPTTTAPGPGSGQIHPAFGAPPPHRHTIRPQGKWRYLPNFLRLSGCPPPMSLLQTCSQLSAEAMAWYYNMAVLQINATGGFAHTSFFEEAFTQLSRSRHSPMRNIRKVAVTFVWDTAWLRRENTALAAAVFPALLRERAAFVVQILKHTPNLNDVVLHWHDTVRDTTSEQLQDEILEMFLALPVLPVIKEHYVADGAKIKKRSVVGKQRQEFQDILDDGMNLM